MANKIDLKKAIPHNDICAACAKQSISSKPHTDHIEPGTYLNELIHSNLIGLLSLSAASAKYFVTFLNNKTKGSEVYFLKDKSRTFPTFKNFKTRWEHRHNTIKLLHTDYRGEYVDYDFELFQYKHGIKWESIVQGTPKQNRAVECLGQTLHQKATTMLEDLSMNIRYWDELVQTANYLQNRSPVNSIGMTFYKAETGIKPKLKHL